MRILENINPVFSFLGILEKAPKQLPRNKRELGLASKRHLKDAGLATLANAPVSENPRSMALGPLFLRRAMEFIRVQKLVTASCNVAVGEDEPHLSDKLTFVADELEACGCEEQSVTPVGFFSDVSNSSAYEDVDWDVDYSDILSERLQEEAKRPEAPLKEFSDYDEVVENVDYGLNSMLASLDHLSLDITDALLKHCSPELLSEIQDKISTLELELLESQKKTKSIEGRLFKVIQRNRSFVHFD